MYIVFGGFRYYARGGGRDALETFTNVSDAIRRAEELYGTMIITREPVDKFWDDGDSVKVEWCHVYSVANNEIVHEVVK